MFCIKCYSQKTQVVNSRAKKKSPAIWRRRKCLVCNHIFTTTEAPELTYNKKVIHPDGSVDDFNIGRLTISIAQSFAHKPNLGRDTAYYLAETVKTALATEDSLNRVKIASTTHVVLKNYDHLAAVQYAAIHSTILGKA